MSRSEDAECAIDGGDNHFVPGFDFEIYRGGRVDDCGGTYRRDWVSYRCRTLGEGKPLTASSKAPVSVITGTEYICTRSAYCL